MQNQPELIIVDGNTYPVTDLNKYGFASAINLPADARSGRGVLVMGDQRLEVEFRVRGKVDDVLSCSFSNFSIGSEEVVQRYLKKRDRVSSGNEELEARTYDELASGMVSSQSSDQATTSDSGEPQRQSKHVKSFVLVALLFVMVGLAVLAAFFMKSRSSLSVTNSALVGNYIPINSRVEGELVEILVAEGDAVRKGDVLLRLVNPELTGLNQQLSAELVTAKSKVATLQRQQKTYDSMLAFASKKLKLDLEVARSELDAANKARESAAAAFERLRPFAQSGAITQLEMDEVENRLRAEEANCTAKENLTRQIEFSQEATNSNVMIIGDRVDDELGRISAELELAQAKVLELEQGHEASLIREKELEIIAPRDGTVYVTYRQIGEYIKVADELIGLSYPGKAWAAGNIAAGQASRVRPGQPVRIKVPSLDLRIDGTVSAVGHRAMYSKGHYNAEFRGVLATDVPIKVTIEDLPENIPSGLRLSMSINTGFGLKWLDDAMGYELRTIGKALPNSKASQAEVKLASADAPVE